MEGLATPDGKPVEIGPAGDADREFAKAMAAPSDVLEPPDREPRKPRGRPRKPETAKAPVKPPESPSKGKAAPVKDDYTAEAQTVVSSAWTVMAMLPVAQPFAYAVSANSEALIAGLAQGAKHNETIRQIVAGPAENAWAITLAAAVANIGMTAYSIGRDPELSAKAREATVMQLKKLAGSQAEELKDADGDTPS